MIRPEQIHLTPANGTNGDYFGGHRGQGDRPRLLRTGHRALDYRLDSPQTTLKARTFDQEIPKVGELVELAVLGPVVVFPPQPKAR